MYKLPDYMYTKSGWCKWYYNPFTWVLTVFLLCTPFTAFAANTHQYSCADFATLTQTTCANDASGHAKLYMSSISSADAYDSVPQMNLPTGTTWYVSFTLTASSTPNNLGYSADSGSYHIASSSITSVANTWASTGGLHFNNHNIASPLFFGFISGICVTDTLGSCETPTATTTVTVTATTTLQYVDNPTLDLGISMGLFFMSFWGIIWFFRLNKK